MLAELSFRSEVNCKGTIFILQMKFVGSALMHLKHNMIVIHEFLFNIVV